MIRVLILGASILQMPLIETAKSLGFYTGVVDYNPNAVGKKISDEFFTVSTNDIDGVYKVAEKFKPNGIVTMATDKPMRTIANVCQRLKLPAISPDTAYKATDKLKMIQAFERNNVESPKYMVLQKLEDIYLVESRIGFPCIFKPVDNAGSRGVIKVDMQEDLQKAFQYCKDNTKEDKILVEEYLTGKEISVEAFVISGDLHILTVTDKLTTGAPFFVEMGHSQPSQIDTITEKQVYSLTERAVDALKIKNGPIHAEMMVNDSKARMIELGARLGGDCITSHLVPLSTGINIVEATLKQACGFKVDIEKTRDEASAIRYFEVGSGIIKDIKGIEEARKYEGVENIVLLKKPGDEIRNMQSSIDRAGYVISSAKYSHKAIEVCEKVLKSVKINVQRND